MAAVVRRIDPHSHDHAARGVAEPLRRPHPAGSGAGRLGVPAPAASSRPLTRAAAGAGALRRDRGQLGQGALGLVEVGRGKNDLRAAAQLVQAEPPGGVVLAEDGGEPVPFSIP